MTSPSIEILAFKPTRKNSLLGFAKIGLPSGMVLIEVCILTGTNGPWASPPSKPMIDRDGQALREPNGKLKYSPVVDFKDKHTRERFSQAVIAAMRTSLPDVFRDSDNANASDRWGDR